MHATTGYCEIFRDEEGTVTAPYVCHPRNEGIGGYTSEYLPENVTGCLNEGVWDVDGNRTCDPCFLTMMELMVMRWGHCDVRLIGE